MLTKLLYNPTAHWAAALVFFGFGVAFTVYFAVGDVDNPLGCAMGVLITGTSVAMIYLLRHEELNEARAVSRHLDMLLRGWPTRIAAHVARLLSNNHEARDNITVDVLGLLLGHDNANIPLGLKPSHVREATRIVRAGLEALGCTWLLGPALDRKPIENEKDIREALAFLGSVMNQARAYVSLVTEKHRHG